MTKAKQRPALALAPTLGYIEPGRDAYVTLAALRDVVRSARRWWTFHDMPTTAERGEGKVYAKLWDRFADHGEADAFSELLREYAELGCPRPSGYADVFHMRHPSPRVAWSVNAMLAPAFAGGWQEALSIGAHAGQFYKYDIRSAYLWAGSLGMPDPKTYRRSTRVDRDEPGVYRVKLREPVKGAPFPFSRARECLASSEEIATYGLPVAEVVAGVTWRRDIDPTRMLDAVRAVSTWKQAGRSYWGRWGQTQRVECCLLGGRKWVLPNVAANIPWAHMIVSRVKSKLWNAADASTVHVYVDSLITARPMRGNTGAGIGEWKLERVYPDGVFIRGTGQYGGLLDERLERMAGVPKTSQLRVRLRENLADAHPELLAG